MVNMARVMLLFTLIRFDQLMFTDIFPVFKKTYSIFSILTSYHQWSLQPVSLQTYQRHSYVHNNDHNNLWTLQKKKKMKVAYKNKIKYFGMLLSGKYVRKKFKYSQIFLFVYTVIWRDSIALVTLIR